MRVCYQGWGRRWKIWRKRSHEQIYDCNLIIRSKFRLLANICMWVWVPPDSIHKVSFQFYDSVSSVLFAFTARHSFLGNLIVHLHLISIQTQSKAPSIGTIRNSYRIMTSFSSTRHSFAERVCRWCEKTAFSRSHDNCSAHAYFFVLNSTKP